MTGIESLSCVRVVCVSDPSLSLTDNDDVRPAGTVMHATVQL